MRQPYNFSTYLIIVALTSMFSCRHNQDTGKNDNSNDNPTTTIVSKDTVIKNGNVTTIISNDIEKLGRLLNFKTYKPTKVKFKYTFIDNSGQNKRLSVPGPSDYSLQVLLYFDSITFEKFLDYDRDADYPSPNNNKDEFKFYWLDKEVLTELDNSKENYHGHPNFFFKTPNSKAWYLDKKILIIKKTN